MHALGVGAIGVALWLAYGSASMNQDTVVMLDWGRDLARGQLPDYDQPFAPTPHPLTTALLGIFSLAGQGFAYGAAVLLSYVSLAAIVWTVFLIGRHLSGWEVGVLAAALALLSAEATWRGIIGQQDIPAAALVLIALALELSRPRRVAVLVPLFLAGLIRPEVWLVSFVYCLNISRNSTAPKRAKYGLLALAAPLLWIVSDYVITGDPLFSARVTRGGAEALQRLTGLTGVLEGASRSFELLIGLVITFASVVALGLGLQQHPARFAKPAALTALWIMAFAVLGATRLPLNPRYLLVPAMVLICFFAYGVLGWARSSGHGLRMAWAMSGIALLGLVVFLDLPSQVDRLADVRRETRRESQAIGDLRSLAARPSAAMAARHCRAIVAQNSQPTPWAAYAFDVPHTRIADGRRGVPVEAVYLEASGPGEALIHNRFYRQTSARREPPAGWRVVARNRSWKLYAGGCA